MNWEPRPLPDVTPESAAYWAAAADERLVVRDCQNCGLVYHYPRTLCPDCLSDDVEWREATGKGEVYSYSVAEAISGWPEERLPLVVAYVELEEGPRMMTNIVDCDPENIEIGMPVCLKCAETEEEDVGVPVFVPKQ